MFCPTCGADRQIPNAYCKRCGEWLPDLKARKRGSFGGETPQQNILTSLFMSALTTLAALFSAIALYATYFGDEAKWSVYVAAIVCVCIAGWQTSSFLAALKLQRRLNNAREKSPVSELAEPGPTRSLKGGDSSAFISSASVIENTTQILDPVTSSNRETKQ